MSLIPTPEQEAEAFVEMIEEQPIVIAGIPGSKPREFAGLTVHKVSEVATDWGQCILLYGPPGAGKTPQAASIAESPTVKKGVLFLDAEGGIRSITHKNNVDVIEIIKWADWTRVRRAIIQDPANFLWDVVVVDNLSEFADISMAAITSGIPTFPDFRKNTDEILNMVRFCRDASRKWGITFVLIAWDTNEQEGDSGPVKKHISFTPKLQEKLPGIVDIIGYITIDMRGTPNSRGELPRIISFAPSKFTAAKFRRSAEENASKIPLEVYDTDITALGDVVSTLKGGLPWKSKHDVPTGSRVALRRTAEVAAAPATEETKEEVEA